MPRSVGGEGAHLDNSHAALPDDVLPLVVHAIVYAAIGYAALAPSLLRRPFFPSRRVRPPSDVC